MSDLFSGLMKGLSSFMPADDPNTQLFKLQNEVNDLKKKESEIYVEIGKAAAEQYGLESFGEVADRLKLTQSNLAAAQQKLDDAQAAEAERKRAEAAAKAERTCPSCGHVNPEGTKFCQECGQKLGSQGNVCPSCGTANAPGIKFCQECGNKLQADPPPEVPANCPNCGQENPPGTRFCGGCGTKLEG